MIDVERGNTGFNINLVNMRKLRGLIVIALLSISYIGMGQQNESSAIEPDAFNTDLFISLLKDRLHEARAKQNADSFVYHEIIMQAAHRIKLTGWLLIKRKLLSRLRMQKC